MSTSKELNPFLKMDLIENFDSEDFPEDITEEILFITMGKKCHSLHHLVFPIISSKNFLIKYYQLHSFDELLEFLDPQLLFQLIQWKCFPKKYDYLESNERLIKSIQLEHTKIATILLKFDRNIEISPPCLLEAALFQNEDLVELLIPEVDVNYQFSLGNTLIFILICYNRSEMIELIIQTSAKIGPKVGRKIDLNIPNNDGVSPLILASSKGSINIVKILLELPLELGLTPVNINYKTPDGHSALSVAQGIDIISILQSYNNYLK